MPREYVMDFLFWGVGVNLAVLETFFMSRFLLTTGRWVYRLYINWSLAHNLFVQETRFQISLFDERETRAQNMINVSFSLYE